ncbi:MAG: hypothetical protein DRI40_03020 [Chloroflexi bacterium]|nr:MAG: hypothetical protein DRI40_03020 [Chloroflexota bacterium]
MGWVLGQRSQYSRVSSVFGFKYGGQWWGALSNRSVCAIVPNMVWYREPQVPWLAYLGRRPIPGGRQEVGQR